jgi:outer membrane immunogenic protein
MSASTHGAADGLRTTWVGHLRDTLILGIPLVGAQLAQTALNVTNTLVLGRLGVAADRALFYVTGGLAFADFGSRVNNTTAAPTITSSSTGTRTGWTLGAGVEYAFTPNWTVRAEYLYANFGSATVTGTSSIPTDRAWRIKNETHTVRVGVNYLFSTGPSAVVARY